MDFILHGGPQDFLLTALTDDAMCWAILNSERNARRIGRSVFIVRDYLDGVLKEIKDDGLTVEDEAARLQVQFRCK